MFELFKAYKALPFGVREVVLSHFSDEELFNKLRDTRPEAMAWVSKDYFNEIRFALFNRRGKKASDFQNIFLLSWLKHWATAQHLSFIQNDADKQQWLILLDAALKDPESSTEHKIRCCLLINALFPSEGDLTVSITRQIRQDVIEARVNESHLSMFISAFSQAEIQEMVTSLTAQVAHTVVGVSRAAKSALNVLAPLKPTKSGITAPHVNETELDTRIKLCLIDPNWLNSVSDDDCKAVATAFGALAGRVRQSKCNEMVSALLLKLNAPPAVRVHVVAALGLIAPHAAQIKCDEMVGPLLDGLASDDWGVLQETATALGLLAPQVTQPKYDEMINAILGMFSHEHWETCEAAVDALGAIASRVKAQNGAMITLLLPLLNHIHFWLRRVAADALGAIAPHVSPLGHKMMLKPLLNSLNDPDSGVRQAVAVALSQLAPYVTQSDCDEMVPPLLKKLKFAELNVIALHASETQRVTMIAPSLTQLNDKSTQKAAIRLLGKLIPDCADDHLKEILACTVEKCGADILPLQYMAQTRLLIRQLGAAVQPPVEQKPRPK